VKTVTTAAFQRVWMLYFSKTFVDESLGLIFATRFQKRSGLDLRNNHRLLITDE
jgi:hypothetical protein